jgi:hypothetical protein
MKLSWFERVAYAALALGGLASVASSMLHTERLLAHWSAVVTLVERLLS